MAVEKELTARVILRIVLVGLFACLWLVGLFLIAIRMTKSKRRKLSQLTRNEMFQWLRIEFVHYPEAWVALAMVIVFAAVVLTG